MTAAQTRTAVGELHLSDGPVHLVRDETTVIIPSTTDSRQRLDRVLDVLTHWSGILLSMAVATVLAIGALR